MTRWMVPRVTLEDLARLGPFESWAMIKEYQDQCKAQQFHGVPLECATNG